MMRILMILTILLNIINAKEITLYINSHLSESITKERWQPTIDLLNKKLPKYRFKLLPIAPNEVDRIKKLLDKKKIDLLITQPAITNTLIHSHSIVPILTMANKYDMSRFGSVFITKNDNNKINTIKDIKGKTIAAVASMGFGGWLIGYNELYDHGIDPIKEKKVTFLGGDQFEVVKSIIDGRYDVGVIRTGMLEMIAEKQANCSMIQKFFQSKIRLFPKRRYNQKLLSRYLRSCEGFGLCKLIEYLNVGKSIPPNISKSAKFVRESFLPNI